MTEPRYTKEVVSDERVEDVLARMRKNWLPGAPEHYWAAEIAAALERERAEQLVAEGEVFLVVESLEHRIGKDRAALLKLAEEMEAKSNTPYIDGGSGPLDGHAGPEKLDEWVAKLRELAGEK